MGFFSKKDYVCEKCGKTFSKRINMNGNLCDECFSHEAGEQRKLELEVGGYVEYHRKLFFKGYSSDEMRAIIEHRESILQKYRNSRGISRAELANVSENYKKLTDEQAAEVLYRVGSSAVNITMGAAYSRNFFVPTGYDGIIVDAEDVFAVGFTTDHGDKDNKNESILCAVFTNDPYVPVFPVIYVGKLGFFELTKSKKGRNNVSEMFESMCPNLTYPVCDIKQLTKQIKQDGEVKGNIDVKFALEQIYDASANVGIFDTKKMCCSLRLNSADMLDKIGYIQEPEIDKILKMDKMFNRNYWTKQMKRIWK